MDDRLAPRLLRTWAADAGAFARVLAERDPGWGSEVHAVGGGLLVLCGAGLYVNRAIAVGLDEALTDDDLDLIVERSRSVGVSPAVEVTPLTHGGTVDRLRARGFVHAAGADVTALTRTPDGPAIATPADVVVRPVLDEADLRRWQDTSARGWGHTDPDARRAADAFAVAAHAVDGDGMVIAHDATDGRPVGCASTTIRDGVATLGGMSTVPEERRRGVQASLLRHRLELALHRGCDVAASTAASGGASERNLRRHGFNPRFTIATWR